MIGFIYAIGDGRGFVKIGWTANPARRLAKLRTDCPTEPFILGILPGAMGDERRAHYRFSKYRARGEWFSLEGEILEFIKTLHPFTAPKKRNVWMGKTETAADVIAALGGTKAVCEFTGASEQSITNWRTKGAIPANFFCAFEKRLAALGLDAPLSIWNMIPVPGKNLQCGVSSMESRHARTLGQSA